MQQHRGDRRTTSLALNQNLCRFLIKTATYQKHYRVNKQKGRRHFQQLVIVLTPLAYCVFQVLQQYSR